MSTTRKKGYKLGCLPQQDARSENFRVCNTLVDNNPLPDVLVTKHWDDHIPALNQGNVGSCVGNGFAHEIASDPLPVPNVDEEFALKLYKLAQTLDGYPLPHDGSSVLAGAKASAQLNYIKEYRWATTLKEVAQALSYLGPVVIGVNWYDDMEDIDLGGYIYPTGAIAGKHCVCLTGITVSNSAFVVRGKNSWGQVWGYNGHFKLHSDDLEKLINEAESAFCVPLLRASGNAPLPTVPWWKRVWERYFA